MTTSLISGLDTRSDCACNVKVSGHHLTSVTVPCFTGEPSPKSRI